jgi:hypothetical protein
MFDAHHAVIASEAMILSRRVVTGIDVIDSFA